MRGGVAAGLAMTGLASCAGVGRETSYIEGLVNPDQRSAVFHWTDLMLQAVRDLSLTPLQASRGFAMAHSAGSIALGNRFTDPVFGGPSQFDGDTAYAVAFSIALEEAWSTSFWLPRRRFLASRRDRAHQDAAIVRGRAAANHVIKQRNRDGSEESRSAFYVSRRENEKNDSALSAAMRWTPTGPMYGARSGPAFERFERGISPGWGWQKPWVITDPAAYRPAPFPDYRSPEFAYQFEKVNDLGRDEASSRTPEQSAIALFWEDGPRGISNPGHFQLIAIDIAQQQQWSLERQAEFFATLSVAQADAGIVAWRSKYDFDILRPETAIRFAASRFNGAGTLMPDVRWQSYIPTPAFPSYVSGHSVFGAASMGVLASILGEDNLDVASRVPDRLNWPNQLTGMTRRWNSLRAIAEENGASREFGGVHWEADNVEGLAMGFQLATEVVAKLDPEIGV